MNLTESHTRHSFQFHDLNSHLNSKESKTHNSRNNLGPFDSAPAKILENYGCKCHIQNTSSRSKAQCLSHQQNGKIFPGNQIENPEAKTKRVMKKVEGKTSQVVTRRITRSMVAATLAKLKSPRVMYSCIRLSESNNESSNDQDKFEYQIERFSMILPLK